MPTQYGRKQKVGATGELISFVRRSSKDQTIPKTRNNNFVILQIMNQAEKSIFMLKPEAVPYKEEIMGMIEKAGIPIVEWRNLKLDEEHLNTLYAKTKGEKWHKTKDHLLGKDVLVAVVEGDNVVERLHKICGEHAKPFLCETDSIRSKFSGILPFGDESYTKNVIHRAKNKEEAEKHLVLFFPPNR